MIAPQINADGFAGNFRPMPFVDNWDDDENLFALENMPFEPIPGLPYTREERLAAIDQSMEDIRAGRTFTTEEVFRPYRQWM